MKSLEFGFWRRRMEESMAGGEIERRSACAYMPECRYPRGLYESRCVRSAKRSAVRRVVV